MRQYCAVYVDAGYALAAAATRVTGTSLRGSIRVDYPRLIETLAMHATTQSGLPLLRTHWYDSAHHGVPDPTQEQIGLLPRVKLRLGRIGVDGEQKGVDLRIGLDLVAQARTARVDVMYLVSGDGDLAEAVEEAQAHGVVVNVLAVPTLDGTARGVSRHLQSAADDMEILQAAELDAAVTARASSTHTAPPATGTPPTAVPSPALLAHRPARPHQHAPAGEEPEKPERDSDPTGAVVYTSSRDTEDEDAVPTVPSEEELAESIDRVAQRVVATWLQDQPGKQGAALDEHRPSIPQEADRALLVDLSHDLGIYDLDEDVRRRLRARFWRHVDSTLRA